MLGAASIGSVSILTGCLGLDEEAGLGDDEEDERPAEDLDVGTIANDPTAIPPPIDRDEPEHHEVQLQTEELVAEVEPDTTYRFMTFDGTIPGPFYRFRVGDTVHLTFDVPEDLNDNVHNIDSHAVFGPGGGAQDTTIRPGEGPVEIQFQLRYPGVHYYHCAPGDHDVHISNGMFGIMLVEPEAGLREVDREFYLGQHELYTDRDHGAEGHHELDMDRMRDENPNYVLFNGEVSRFTDQGEYGPLPGTVDEEIRVFWVNAGPNLVSNPHPIGNVWQRWYEYGDLRSEPKRFVEGAALPPGTAAMGELVTPVPGPIHLVDHALTRVVRKGLHAIIDVEGEEDPDTYDPDP